MLIRHMKVLACTCHHDYQDAVHGKGRRVHTPIKTAKGMTPSFRCTICLKQRDK